MVNSVNLVILCKDVQYANYLIIVANAWSDFILMESFAKDAWIIMMVVINVLMLIRAINAILTIILILLLILV